MPLWHYTGVLFHSVSVNPLFVLPPFRCSTTLVCSTGCGVLPGLVSATRCSSLAVFTCAGVVQVCCSGAPSVYPSAVSLLDLLAVPPFYRLCWSSVLDLYWPFVVRSRLLCCCSIVLVFILLACWPTPPVLDCIDAPAIADDNVHHV